MLKYNTNNYLTVTDDKKLLQTVLKNINTNKPHILLLNCDNAHNDEIDIVLSKYDCQTKNVSASNVESHETDNFLKKNYQKDVSLPVSCGEYKLFSIFTVTFENANY